MTDQQPVPRSQPALTARSFSPLGCSAAVRLLVATVVAIVLWLVVFWALNPN